MRRSVVYPLLFVLCGGLSVGLLLWSARQTPPPGWEPPTAVPDAPVEEIAPLPPPPEPEPVVQEAEPEPEPEPVVAPEPTPPPVSDEELLGPLPAKGGEPHANEAKHSLLPPPGAIAAVDPGEFGTLSMRPAAWPQVVRLLKPLRLPVFLNGTQAGSVLVPAGTVVALRKVGADGTVEVTHARSFATLPARDTDLSARVTALLRSGTTAAVAAAPTPTPEPVAPAPVVTAEEVPARPVSFPQ